MPKFCKDQVKNIVFEMNRYVVYAVDRMNFQDIIIPSEVLKPYIYVGLTLLIAVIVDNVLRSLIKVPKPFANRRANNAAVIIRNLISIGVYAIAIYTILSLLGVNLGPLLASASIIGIIIGIGARSTIEDFVTGLFFLSLDSMAVGEYVKIGEAEGYVETIGARTLTIRALDGSLHVFPNSQVKGLANFSRNKSTIFIDLPVKSNQNIDKVLKAAEDALDELKNDKKFDGKLLPESEVSGIENYAQPEIMVLRITLIAYPIHRWTTARAYRLLVKKAFEKNKLLFA